MSVVEEVAVQHRSRVLAPICVAVVALVVTGCSGHVAPRDALLHPTALAVASCTRVAEADSTTERPAMTFTTTTAGRAEQLLYGSVAHSADVDLPSIPVVALVATGSFDGRSESHPAGAGPTPGTVVTCVAALEDGGVMDWSEGDVHQDLGRLGTAVIRL